MNRNFCVRVVNRDTEVVKSFPSEMARKFWLCSNGFYPMSGVWVHMDGRKAGIFILNDKKSYDSCLKKVVSCDSMWDSILRDKNVAG